MGIRYQLQKHENAYRVTRTLISSRDISNVILLIAFPRNILVHENANPDSVHSGGYQELTHERALKENLLINSHVVFRVISRD